MINGTNGICPNCKSIFDARKAVIAFPVHLAGNKVPVIFALCPECIQLLENSSKISASGVVKTCCSNLFNDPHADWTVTTSLALNANYGDFFDAWWIGLDIPRVVFDEINEGGMQVFSAYHASHGGANHA
jgi:hypothetical protein